MKIMSILTNLNTLKGNNVKNYIALTLAVSLPILAGCGTKVSLVRHDFPAVGVVATKSVGDELIGQAYGQIGQKLDLLKDEIIGTTRLPKGHYYAHSENKTKIRFVKNDNNANFDFYINKQDQKICITGNDCTQVEYLMSQAVNPYSIIKGTFQRTLIYNGKIGNRVTFGYREFADGIARSAFSNTVEYDLSESTLVGYKGARIDIIKASNTELTYKVISGFD